MQACLAKDPCLSLQAGKNWSLPFGEGPHTPHPKFGCVNAAKNPTFVFAEVFGCGFKIYPHDESSIFFSSRKRKSSLKAQTSGDGAPFS